jgi:outer membrane receptor protein involved in Fe transport
VKLAYLNTVSIATLLLFAGAANAETFNIPSGDLKSALDAYARQTGVNLIVAGAEVNGVQTKGAQGDFSTDGALSHLLSGTGFSMHRRSSGAIGIMRDQSSNLEPVSETPIQLAQAAAVARPSVETVTVTSSKLGGADVQTVPIAITAMSQEQLTATQTAGGPDLVKNVPNLTFTKTNFSGYSIQIRGIGTQAVSVTIDPAVAVSFNDTPFIRNHFFEQEFYDVAQVEVLRGPQGTLYGRNSTAGVVNVITAKPTGDWEARASIDVGNYENRRMEGMLNVPLLDDKLGLRVAGEWTKRDGYSFNQWQNKSVDGRDLWSGRATLQMRPTENLSAALVYEHFSENDDRLRSGKQLCERDPGATTLNGPNGPVDITSYTYKGWVGQGCLPGSLYSPSAFGTPNANANPFVATLQYVIAFIPRGTDPYADVEQAKSLRVIDSYLSPTYEAKNDTFEFNVDYNVSPELKLTSQTGYNKDHLASSEDYTRFRSISNVFIPSKGLGKEIVGQDGQFCDPQFGCSDRLVGQDISRESAYQFTQEVRLTSSFEGPLNFSVGANYMHYQTREDYFVFYNAITLLTRFYNQTYGGLGGLSNPAVEHAPFDAYLANYCGPHDATLPFDATGTLLGLGCSYIDPNPIDAVDGQGHNYFRSNNPYRLNSWAVFGEANYQIAPDVKLTGGLRFTNDRKHFTEYPSWTAIAGKGYPQGDVIRQEWGEVTGRAVINWTPKLDFTDQTLVYGSYSHGYKAGGANPPGVIPIVLGTTNLSSAGATTHPKTFKPEFNDAFEVGTKNTLLDGDMTLNLSAFYYSYKNYQISQIVDRTAVNLNFDAKVMGAELEATWEPLPGLRFNLAAGYENAPVDDGQSAIDLMDRTAGHTDWVVFKPYVTATSNCILPVSVVIATKASPTACLFAYSMGSTSYGGFDPTTAPNNGQGFTKSLDGKQLPNTPPVTLSAGTQYSMPLSADWAATLRGDFYWQADSYARIFNSRPYDELHGYSNFNFALIFTNQDGWQAMAYVKNAFDTTAITGAFLNSDDSGLTTNVFLTDPRLFGIRLTKNW